MNRIISLACFPLKHRSIYSENFDLVSRLSSDTDSRPYKSPRATADILGQVRGMRQKAWESEAMKFLLAILPDEQKFRGTAP